MVNSFCGTCGINFPTSDRFGGKLRTDASMNSYPPETETEFEIRAVALISRPRDRLLPRFWRCLTIVPCGGGGITLLRVTFATVRAISFQKNVPRTSIR